MKKKYIAEGLGKMKEIGILYDVFAKKDSYL